MYDEGYWEYIADKARKALEELLNMSDEELASRLANTPEEETMRALGYTKKEGSNNGQ